MVHVGGNAISSATGFVSWQKRNYGVAIAHSVANSLLPRLTAQYDTVHSVALGAGSVELGKVNSIGNSIGALVSRSVGWLADRCGLNRCCVLGAAMVAGSALIARPLPGIGHYPAPILGGLIWDYLDPAYVFLIPLVVDLLGRVPLLTTIPETLA